MSGAVIGPIRATISGPKSGARRESYELAVIGAGPAGLEAALAAAQAGVKTVIIDHLPQAGGQYYKALPAAFQAGGKTGTEAEGEELAMRLERSGARRIFNALTWGIFKEENPDGWQVTLYGPGAPGELHARRIILANGAYDTPLAFPGWTLPGVITCGAALLLVKNQRVAPFRRALVSGSGPLLLSAAAHLAAAGVQVVRVCEANRPLGKAIASAAVLLGERRRLMEGAAYLGKLLGSGVPYSMGWSVVEAHGQEQVEQAVVARLDAGGAPVAGTQQEYAVDGVVCGYGLTPNSGLARMIGCKFEYRPEQGGWVTWRDEGLQTSQPGVYLAGDCAGIGGAELARLEGRLAGLAVALESGRLSQALAEQARAQVQGELAQQRRFARLLGELFPLKAGLLALAGEDTLLCRCEEVTLGEVRAAVQAGARTLNEVKMVTRAGMGNCQGRTCEGPVSGAIVHELAGGGVSAEGVGMYSVRPPLHPLQIGFFAESGLA